MTGPKGNSSEFCSPKPSIYIPYGKLKSSPYFSARSLGEGLKRIWSESESYERDWGEALQPRETRLQIYLDLTGRTT